LPSLEAGKIALPQPKIDIAAAQPAQQPRQEMQFLQRRVRGGKRTQRVAAVLLAHPLQTLRRVLQRDRPIDLFPAAAAADHRARQPLR
jgi:hypothetical protein